MENLQQKIAILGRKPNLPVGNEGEIVIDLQQLRKNRFSEVTKLQKCINILNFSVYQQNFVTKELLRYTKERANYESSLVYKKETIIVRQKRTEFTFLCDNAPVYSFLIVTPYEYYSSNFSPVDLNPENQYKEFKWTEPSKNFWNKLFQI